MGLLPRKGITGSDMGPKFFLSWEEVASRPESVLTKAVSFDFGPGAKVADAQFFVPRPLKS